MHPKLDAVPAAIKLVIDFILVGVYGGMLIISVIIIIVVVIIGTFG